MKIPRFQGKEEKRFRVLEWVLVLRPPLTLDLDPPLFGWTGLCGAHPKGPLDDGWHYTPTCHLLTVRCVAWVGARDRQSPADRTRCWKVSGVRCPTLVAGDTFRSTDDENGQIILKIR